MGGKKRRKKILTSLVETIGFDHFGFKQINCMAVTAPERLPTMQCKMKLGGFWLGFFCLFSSFVWVLFPLKLSALKTKNLPMIADGQVF